MTENDESQNQVEVEVPPVSVQIPRVSAQTLKTITTNFAPCGRCGHFWVGYRVLAGEQLATAITEEGDWLLLTWQVGMRELLHKSYGARLDIAHDYFSATCNECQRDYVFEHEDEEKQPLFRIKKLPG